MSQPGIVAVLGAVALMFVLPPLAGLALALLLRGVRLAAEATGLADREKRPPFYVELLRGMMLAVMIGAVVAIMLSFNGGVQPR